MLSEIYIENLAIIEKTAISFTQGFNVFTGETGAGKSIVIDAINAILGQRTSKDFVRHGQKKAVVIATFDNLNQKAISKLEELGYELEDEELIVTREISVDGKSKAHIMGRPVNISVLKDLGTELINIHGQHDNQILLEVDKHIDILDSYGEFDKLLEKYQECYKQVVQIKREMNSIMVDEGEKAKQIDLYTYQIEEINNANLEIGEEEELVERRNEIQNHAKIVEQLNKAYLLVNGQDGEGGAIEMFQLAEQSLDKISDCSNIEELYSKASSINEELYEFSNLLSNKLDSIEFNPNELEEIEDRISLISDIKYKYGNSVEDVFAYLEEISGKLDNLNLSEERLLELKSKGEETYKKVLEHSAKLSEHRSKTAIKFSKNIAKELVFLDMPNVQIEVKIDTVKPNFKGVDNIEFMISTNKGEPPKPIAKIASGGELSRMMLAIKNTLAGQDEVQTLIFDEIDTGVSGSAARKIGLKLKQVAKNRQVLCVTHLAQIAGLADTHFLIKKETKGDKTSTLVTSLDMDGRVHEVARIMSTDKITDLMLESAREIIEQTNLIEEE